MLLLSRSKLSGPDCQDNCPMLRGQVQWRPLVMRSFLLHQSMARTASRKFFCAGPSLTSKFKSSSAAAAPLMAHAEEAQRSTPQCIVLHGPWRWGCPTAMLQGVHHQICQMGPRRIKSVTVYSESISERLRPIAQVTKSGPGLQEFDILGGSIGP